MRRTITITAVALAVLLGSCSDSGGEPEDRYTLMLDDGTEHAGRTLCEHYIGDFYLELRQVPRGGVAYRFDLDGHPMLRPAEYTGTVEATLSGAIQAVSRGTVTVDATFERTNRQPIGSGTFEGSYAGGAGNATFTGEFECVLEEIVP